MHMKTVSGVGRGSSLNLRKDSAFLLFCLAIQEKYHGVLIDDSGQTSTRCLVAVKTASGILGMFNRAKEKKNVSLPASTYFAFTLTFEFLNSSRPFSLLFPRWYRSTKTSEKSNRDGLRIGRMDEFSAEKEVGGEQKKRAVLYP